MENSQKLPFSAILKPVEPAGGRGMALEYTEEKLNSLDKKTVIQLFLSQQEQLKQIDHNLHLVLEQLADLKRHRFGRSSERHEPDEQISFMEVDGKLVFFNEPEAVAAEESDETLETVPRRKPKKKQGKREEDLDGLPVVVVEHSMTEEEGEPVKGQPGFPLAGSGHNQCQICQCGAPLPPGAGV